MFCRSAGHDAGAEKPVPGGIAERVYLLGGAVAGCTYLTLTAGHLSPPAAASPSCSSRPIYLAVPPVSANGTAVLFPSHSFLLMNGPP